PTVVYSHTPRCLSRARRAPPCPYPTLFRSMLPDRDHLHHIFMRAGFSERQALAIITLVAVVLAAVGLAGESLQAPEWVMCVGVLDRKSTRLNSSHVKSSYAGFCLQQKERAR